MNSLHRIFAIAQTELRIASRNRWVFLSTLVFVLFSLALAFPGVGAAGRGRASGRTPGYRCCRGRGGRCGRAPVEGTILMSTRG